MRTASKEVDEPKSKLQLISVGPVSQGERGEQGEIAAGRDVAFWLDKAYTHYDNSLLTEEDIAEVETLAQEYYDALDAASDAASENAATNEQIENGA